MVCVRTTFLLGVVLAIFLVLGCDNPANTDSAAADDDDDPAAPGYTNTITINGSSYDIASVVIEEDAGSRIVNVETSEVVAPAMSAPDPDPPSIVVQIHFDESGEIPVGTYESTIDFDNASVCIGTDTCNLLDDTVSDVTVSIEIGGADDDNVTVSGTIEFTYGGDDYTVEVSYDGEYVYIQSIPPMPV